MTRIKLLSVAGIALLALCVQAQEPSGAPLPDVRKLMQEVEQHQKQVDKIRENYTYTSLQTTQDIDSSGQVKKTASDESEVFFVNGHRIDRAVKKDGKPLDPHDEQK